MDKEQTYDRIEAYLSGTLSPEEQRDFAARMAADPALAEEVALHGRLAQFLADGEKLALRQQLAELAEEFPAPGAGSTSRWGWWIGALALVIVVVLGLWRYVGREEPLPATRQTPPVIVEDTLTTDTAARRPPPSTAPPLTTSPPSTEKPRREPAHRSFAPNPSLEQALGPAQNSYFTVEEATLEAKAAEASGSYELVFFGRLLTALEQPELQLMLLDNRRPAGELVGTLAVAVTLIEDENRVQAFAARKAYRLGAAGQLKLSPGLYYVRLQVVGTTEPLWTGKVTVGR